MSRDLTLQGLEANFQKNSNRAEEYFTSAVNSDPKNVEARMNLAEMYRQRGSVNAAIEQLKECQRIARDDEKVLVQLGQCYIESNQPDQAVRLANQALRKNKEQFDAWHLKGNAEWKMGQRDRALSSYMRALRVDPNHLEVRSNVAVLYQELGKPSRALLTLDQMSKEFDEQQIPDWIVLQQAFALKKLNRNTEAISRMATPFRHGTFSPQLAQLYVDTLTMENRHAEALSAARIAARQFPQDQQLNQSLAQLENIGQRRYAARPSETKLR